MTLVGGLIFVAVRAGLALIQPITLNYPIKKWAAMAGLIGALFYLFVSGASISTQRAFIMISIMFVAIMVDRPAVSMRNVAIAATFVLLSTPESLLHVSFQMSFAAVIGLVATYEWRRDRYLTNNRESWAWARGFSPWRLFVAYLFGLAATTAIAEIMIAPFAAFHFNRVATLGIVANLVAVPLVGFLIMPMGVLALLLVPLGLELSDISACGTDGVDCVTEDFWLIVVTEGNADDPEIHEFEGRRRDGGTGHPAQDAQAIFS